MKGLVIGWETIHIKNPFTKRARCMAIAMDDQILLYGGTTSSEQLSDVYLFNPSTMNLRMLSKNTGVSV